MPLVRPLCQKPPSPMIDTARLPPVGAEGGSAGGAQPVAHDAVAHVERRQRRERVAADVGADVQRPGLLLQQLHRREERPFRAADAQTRRPRRHERGELARRHQRHFAARGAVIGDRPAAARRRPLVEELAAVPGAARRRCTPRASAALPCRRGALLTSRWRRIWFAACSMYSGWPFLDDEHGALAAAEALPLLRDQRIGDVEHVERHAGSCRTHPRGRAAPARAAYCCTGRPAARCRCRARSPRMNSFRPRSAMKRCAAGSRVSIFSRSCA